MSCDINHKTLTNNVTEDDYDYTLNFARNTTSSRLYLAALFSFLAVVGSGSIAAGDFVVAPNRGLVNAADEVFEQARKNGPESIGGFKIYGNKGLVGDSYARNIFLVEAETKGAASLRGLTNTLEAEAKLAGAKDIRIIGHAVFNKGFLNPKIAERFGNAFRQINDETIELFKVLD